MNDELDYSNQETREPRPRFLLVLCILSFISIGWTLLQGLYGLLTGPNDEETMLQLKVEFTKSMTEMSDLGMNYWASFFDKMIHLTESTNAAHYAVVTSNIVIVLIGLLGVIWMLKGRKLGFHLYIIYSLLSSVQIYFFVSATYVPTLLITVNLVISAIFILLYGLNLRWMK